MKIITFLLLINSLGVYSQPPRTYLTKNKKVGQQGESSPANLSQNNSNIFSKFFSGLGSLFSQAKRGPGSDLTCEEGENNIFMYGKVGNANGDISVKKLSKSYTSDGEVKFYISSNRCKAGFLVFGDQKCRAMNKGKGRSTSEQTSKGKDSSGQACTWKAASGGGQGGGSSIPIKNYPLSLDNGRSGLYKGGAYGKYPPIYMGGGPVQIHSVGALDDESNKRIGLNYLEATYSSGCVIVSHSCIKAINEYIKNNGGKGNFKAEEINDNEINSKWTEFK